MATGDRPGLPAERGAHRGHRPRPRLRPRPRRACQRGRPRPLPARGLRPRRVGGRRVARAAQPVRRDARRHPQPLWSRPAPSTPEGEVVSWADRIAYVCHDWEDAVSAGDRDARHLLPDVRAAALRRAPGAAAAAPSSTAPSRPRSRSGGWAWTRSWPRPSPPSGAATTSTSTSAPPRWPRARRSSRCSAGPRRALRRPARPHPRRAGDRRSRPGAAPTAVRAAVTYVAGMTDRFAMARPSASSVGTRSSQGHRRLRSTADDERPASVRRPRCSADGELAAVDPGRAERVEPRRPARRRPAPPPPRDRRPRTGTPVSPPRRSAGHEGDPAEQGHAEVRRPAPARHRRRTARSAPRRHR